MVGEGNDDSELKRKRVLETGNKWREGEGKGERMKAWLLFQKVEE